MSTIKPITMPKWGLAMEEGVLARWAVEEGAEIAAGQEIMDIETTKIANVFESPVAGVLRRKVVHEGETVPVGALLGVVAEAGVADAEVESFVGAFLENFKPAEKGEAAPVAETIDAGGRRIRRLKAGPDQGTPILMIHGFGADHTTWMFNMAELSEDRTVHAIDLPGHGGSEKDVGDGSVEALAAAVIAYMDAAGISSAHLVGHSLGGAVAVEIAAASPGRATALTLVAPAGFGQEIARDFIDGFIAEIARKEASSRARDARRRSRHDHARHGRGRAQVQAPRRRARRPYRHRRRQFPRRRADALPCARSSPKSVCRCRWSGVKATAFFPRITPTISPPPSR